MHRLNQDVHPPPPEPAHTARNAESRHAVIWCGEWRHLAYRRVMTSTCRTHRPGLTLVETLAAMAIMSVASLTGLYALHSGLDHIATRDAVRAAGAMVASARDDAVALHTPVSMRIDTATATLELLSRAGLLKRLALGSLHGVALTTTRDSISFDVRGLGFGAANFTLVARRGLAADTLVVSRLGRVRD